VQGFKISGKYKNNKFIFYKIPLLPVFIFGGKKAL